MSSRMIFLNYIPCIPILPKMYHLLLSCLWPLPCMDCPALSPKPTVCRKPCRWGKNPIQQQKKEKKISSFPTPEKSPSSNGNFHVITQHPIQASFIAVVIAVVSFFFNFRLYVQMYSNFDYLRVIRSMTKALNGQNSSKQNSQSPPHLSMLFGKPRLINSLFSSLFLPFIFQILQIYSHSTPVVII